MDMAYSIVVATVAQDDRQYLFVNSRAANEVVGMGNAHRRICANILSYTSSCANGICEFVAEDAGGRGYFREWAGTAGEH